MRWIGWAFAMMFIVATFCAKSSTAAEFPDISGSSQLVLVLTDTWDDVRARMLLFTRDEKGWQNTTEYPAVVGAKGLAWAARQLPNTDNSPIKKEGDRKGPAGVFQLIKAMGYETVPPAGAIFPYEQIVEGMHCVDDLESKYYNRIVSEKELHGPPKELWKSSEIMKRKDVLYKWLVVVDHNIKAPIAGAGSCIFIHVWRSKDKGTAGCTALQEKDIIKLITWLDTDRQPVLVQLPRQEYEKLWESWGLPAPKSFSAH